MNERSETNPYEICTWKPISECEYCPIAGLLKCRFNLGDLLLFIGLFLFALIPALAGMFLGGSEWYLLGWLGLAIAFFGFWEIRILCSHCPYYAEKSVLLHCIANYGCPKFWKYHPEPISTTEKIQLVIGIAAISGYPLPFMILGGQFFLFLLTVSGLILFFLGLQKFVCSKCVNLSCILNRVPNEIVEEYLRRNPVMKKAWESNGWRIGDRD